MSNMLLVPATIVASGLQVGRNALQRGVMSSSGAWRATLVRFLFGLPFSLVFVALATLLVPGADPQFTPAFWTSAVAGAASQVLATAALLVAMHRAGFAVGTALQQSSLPLAALLGLFVYHDHISGMAWAGVIVTSIGLAALTWPSPQQIEASLAGAALGLISGLFFGFSLNAFRHAALALDRPHPVFAAIVSVAVVQAMQTATLSVVLFWRDRAALAEVLRRWRPSLAAGLCGACASSGWFVALALSPAAPVRALGIIEAPIAAIADHRYFRERLGTRQVVAGIAVIAGVLLTSLMGGECAATPFIASSTATTQMRSFRTGLSLPERCHPFISAAAGCGLAVRAEHWRFEEEQQCGRSWCAADVHHSRPLAPPTFATATPSMGRA